MQISCRDFIPPKFYTSSKSEFYLSGTESTTLFSIHRIIKRCSRQFLEENRFQPTRYSLSRQHINFLKDNRRNSEIKSKRCVFFFSLFDNRLSLPWKIFHQQSSKFSFEVTVLMSRNWHFTRAGCAARISNNWGLHSLQTLKCAVKWVGAEQSGTQSTLQIGYYTIT